MSADPARALRYVVCGCVAITIASSPVPTTEARVPVRPALVLRSSSPDRVWAPMELPKHIPVARLRADRRGDTPLSSKYFKLTNLTAEVGGFGGSALAVNEDGRIAYNDYGNGEDVAPQPYIITNGGMYAALSYPLEFCEFRMTPHMP
jgi:hypothetical protein